MGGLRLAKKMCSGHNQINNTFYCAKRQTNKRMAGERHATERFPRPAHLLFLTFPFFQLADQLGQDAAQFRSEASLEICPSHVTPVGSERFSCA